MKTIRALMFVALVLLALGVSDQFGLAQSAGKLVAVLELNNKAGLTDDEAYFLTNKVRNVASQMLPPGKFVIMTRENIDALLPPGADLKKCTDAKCEIEVGRKLGAEYIVTGEILRFGGDLRIQVSVHHVPSGNFLGSRDTSPAPLASQENQLLAATREIIGLVLNHAGVASAPPTTGGVVFAPSTQPAAPTAAAELREIPPSAAPAAGATGPAGLYITTNPPGAEVYIGTVKAGTASPAYQNTNLQAGQRIRVTLKLALYHDLSFDVDLKSGFTKFENVALKPAFGSLTIESDPSGAKVFIGGQEVGATPYANPRYPSGDYLVTLEKEWYAPLSDQTISVHDGEATKQTFKLSQDFGTLEVASNPSGAEVTLNGKRLGATPASFRVPPVKNGKLEIVLATYRSKAFEISIDRGQTVKISGEQATLAAKVGSLQVSTDPPEPGAKVFLDGKEVGTAPLSLDQVHEGRHEIKIETAEKTGQSQTNVIEGQPSMVSVPLRRKGPVVVSQIGRYMLTDCQSIVDSKSGLEWFEGPDSDTDWFKAKSWVDSLRACEGEWRMPSGKELKALYVAGGKDSGALKSTGYWIWSAELSGEKAWGYDVRSGDQYWVPRREATPRRRAIALRAVSAPIPAVRTKVGRFVLTECHSVLDSRTGLEWFEGPENDTTWPEAEQWVRELRTCGGGWRMPTGKELQALYASASKVQNVLQSSAYWIWSKEKNGQTAWGYDVRSGDQYWVDQSSSDPNRRAIAVRSAAAGPATPQ